MPDSERQKSKAFIFNVDFFESQKLKIFGFKNPPGLVIQFMWGKKSETERTSIDEDQLLGLQNLPLPLSHADTVSFLPSLVNKATASSGQKD